MRSWCPCNLLVVLRVDWELHGEYIDTAFELLRPVGPQAAVVLARRCFLRGIPDLARVGKSVSRNCKTGRVA